MILNPEIRKLLKTEEDHLSFLLEFSRIMLWFSALQKIKEPEKLFEDIIFNDTLIINCTKEERF